MSGQPKIKSVLIQWFLNLPFMKAFEMSLRAKVTIGVVIPLIIFLGAITVIDYNSTRKFMLENLSTISSYAGDVVESSIRHGMIENDFENIQQMLDSMTDNNDFEILYILKPTGEVAFSPGGKGVGIRLDNSQDECLPCHILPPNDRPRSIVVKKSDGQEVFRSMQPIRNKPECFACHDQKEQYIGVLLTDISISPFNQALNIDLKRNLILWSLVIAFTVMVVYLSLNKFVLLRDIPLGS